jgi:hypothetical protein
MCTSVETEISLVSPAIPWFLCCGEERPQGFHLASWMPDEVGIGGLAETPPGKRTSRGCHTRQERSASGAPGRGQRGQACPSSPCGGGVDCVTSGWSPWGNEDILAFHGSRGWRGPMWPVRPPVVIVKCTDGCVRNPRMVFVAIK